MKFSVEEWGDQMDRKEKDEDKRYAKGAKLVQVLVKTTECHGTLYFIRCAKWVGYMIIPECHANRWIAYAVLGDESEPLTQHL